MGKTVKYKVLDCRWLSEYNPKEPIDTDTITGIHIGEDKKIIINLNYRLVQPKRLLCQVIVEYPFDGIIEGTDVKSVTLMVNICVKVSQQVLLKYLLQPKQLGNLAKYLIPIDAKALHQQVVNACFSQN